MITREIGWNNGLNFAQTAVIDILIGLTVIAVIIYQLRKRFPLWKIGKPENRFGDIGKRIYTAIVNGFFQKSALKDFGPGIIHAFLFWGFVVLFIGTTIIFFQEYFIGPFLGIHFFEGNFYLFFSFCMDLFGLLALIAVVAFAIRRYLLKPARLDNKPEDAVALILLFLILVTGFLLEASRLACEAPDFEKWSFVGWTLKALLPDSEIVHRVLWWIHLIFSVWFLLILFSSKFLHIFLTWSNQYFRNLDQEKIGAIKPIPQEEFETAENFGLSGLGDLTWKQIFDTDACMRCGRCQNVCPASNTNKALSPKELVQEINLHWRDQAPALSAKDKKEAESSKKLNGEIVSTEETWDCTNCRHCEEVCPAFIEHVSLITGLRQNLVMVEGDIPGELQDTLTKLENQGNPWGLGGHTRGDWAKDLSIPQVSAAPDAEVILYIGCAGSFSDRNQMISKALVKVLQVAGIKFAMFGAQEVCCGDPARRAGNEYLYQMMAEANMEMFDSHRDKKIVTLCAHCFHMFKKEYPLLGKKQKYNIFHHSDYIDHLLKQGSLKVKSGQNQTRTTFHDSCFLGRYNDLYEPSRSILGNLGIDILEMKRQRNNSFCCGAGGARMWMEEDKDKRVNIARTKEALATNADRIVTACPYCMTMFKDGLDEIDNTKRCVDIAECVAESLD